MATLPRCTRRRKRPGSRPAPRRRRRRQARLRRPRPAPLPGALRRVAGALLAAFAAAFTRPTYQRFVFLLLAAILTTGGRTVLNLLRTAGALAPGHPSTYHRVFARRRWSPWRLGRALAGPILRRWVPHGGVALAGDDTVAEHRGPRVYGKGCHRDPARSTHGSTAYRGGHKWVVRAILVRFPLATRPWALPVLAALYRPQGCDRRQGRRHKTPARRLRQLVAVLAHWFPDRRFVLTADGNYATHDLAAFAHRHRRRLALVSKFYAGANLYAPPPKPAGKKKPGRPRGKGPSSPRRRRWARRRRAGPWQGAR